MSVVNKLYVKSDASITGLLGVAGATTLSNVSATGTLGVTGATTLSDTLAVTGAATLSDTLEVVGVSTLASASVTGAATVGTTLAVTGATTLSSTLDVTGVATLASATVTGDCTVNGNLNVLGTTNTTNVISNNVNFTDKYLMPNAPNVNVVGTSEGGIITAVEILNAPNSTFPATGSVSTITFTTSEADSLVTPATAEVARIRDFQVGDYVHVTSTSKPTDSGVFAISAAEYLSSVCTLTLASTNNADSTSFTQTDFSGSASDYTVARARINIMQSRSSGWFAGTILTEAEYTEKITKVLTENGDALRVTLTGNTNQLIFSHSETGGTDFSTTVNVLEPVQNTLLTVPLTGATDTFMMLGVAQEVSGVNTFTAAPILQAGMSVQTGTTPNTTATFTSAVTNANKAYTIPNATTGSLLTLTDQAIVTGAMVKWDAVAQRLVGFTTDAVTTAFATLTAVEIDQLAKIDTTVISATNWDGVSKLASIGGDVTTDGAFTTSGAFPMTLIAAASTTVTLPIAGTLATLAGAETLTNKRVAATVVALADASIAPALLASISDSIYVLSTTAATPQTLTLPAATAFTGLSIKIIAKSVFTGGNITVVAPASGLIDDTTSGIVLSTTGQHLSLTSDGVQWYIM